MEAEAAKIDRQDGNADGGKNVCSIKKRAVAAEGDADVVARKRSRRRSVCSALKTAPSAPGGGSVARLLSTVAPDADAHWLMSSSALAMPGLLALAMTAMRLMVFMERQCASWRNSHSGFLAAARWQITKCFLYGGVNINGGSWRGCIRWGTFSQMEQIFTVARRTCDGRGHEIERQPPAGTGGLDSFTENADMDGGIS